MPPGTPPQKVLSAVRNFAREEFYGQHRYAMVLHTDEPHPHVHLVLKGVSGQGVRLNIRKATLRHWRSQFASHLRHLGVAANATERAVRGESRAPMKDANFRASLRGESSHRRTKAERIARGIAKGDALNRSQRLLDTRAKIEVGWRAVHELLVQQGGQALASQVSKYVRDMPPARSDQEDYAAKLRGMIPRRKMIQGWAK